MSYKTIVVHLDTSRRAHPRLEVALHLAKQFGAHLTGVFAVFSPNPRSLSIMAGTASYYATHEQLRAERRGALERLFHAELGRAGVEGEWIAVDEPANLALPNRSRCADLIVAGQDNPNDPESYVDNAFPEHLVMSAGRPVLLVPYATSVTLPGDHVMVGWDGSREAARAVHDALPFMRAARLTTIVTVNGTHGDSQPPIAGADIAAVLARHGVRVEIRNVEAASGLAAGDMLLSTAAGLEADLLVMGAYAHTRWQELVLGGATRAVLKSMTLPVLMSH
ncbi:MULTISPECIES: universal stress protein [Paraburkholderia]|uniref:Nucleotide-binding universal stress UspA family protein n=2 Tax=Paraburkholderia TaxID=1822464 RepID=A0A7Z0B3B4_9BURK|nr:universal stress protein [Paraburkholderia bryophila]NYH19926.1 nucleotide-binding universal stress UspA family protein [Paraburkholderia bryophila]NYH21045.1 nucleotide-binding universal stress UspA family protein [Paraburkholderia bryophila]